MLNRSTKPASEASEDSPGVGKLQEPQTLAAAVALINQAEAARIAKSETASRITLQNALDARSAAAGVVEIAKARFDELEKVPAESLPDSDADIREHFVNVQIAGVRVSKAEKTLADAEAAAVEAQRIFDDEFRALEAAHQNGTAERAAFLRNADDRFGKHAGKLVELLIEAVALDAWAKALEAGGRRPDPLASDAVALRVELVDVEGRSLFKIDSTSPLAGDA